MSVVAALAREDEQRQWEELLAMVMSTFLLTRDDTWSLARRRARWEDGLEMEDMAILWTVSRGAGGSGGGGGGDGGGGDDCDGGGGRLVGSRCPSRSSQPPRCSPPDPPQSWFCSGRSSGGGRAPSCDSTTCSGTAPFYARGTAASRRRAPRSISRTSWPSTPSP